MTTIRLTNYINAIACLAASLLALGIGGSLLWWVRRTEWEYPEYVVISILGLLVGLWFTWAAIKSVWSIVIGERLHVRRLLTKHTFHWADIGVIVFYQRVPRWEDIPVARHLIMRVEFKKANRSAEELEVFRDEALRVVKFLESTGRSDKIRLALHEDA
ncbi:MAG: hypothetical protein H7Y06_09540 [Opitutaceae bacterium]|nr:hypothetical protein [Opitutaceae bacterium]